MIASFPMYERPETHAANAEFWQLIRQYLIENSIPAPEALSQGADVMSAWTDPLLVLSQTCGMPYRNFLHDKVKLVGTLDYGLANCPPGYYRSCFVTRKSDPRKTLAAFQDAVFAYNEKGSQSGFAAPLNHMAAFGLQFKDQRPSGRHVNSGRMVANWEADIAALDGVTWRLMQRYDRFAEDLQVLSWTEPATPGLPLITSCKNSTSVVYDAVKFAIGGLDVSSKKTLSIRGLIKIPEQAYLLDANPSSYH